MNWDSKRNRIPILLFYLKVLECFMKSLVEFIKYQQINEAQLYKGGEELCKYISRLIQKYPKKDTFIINGNDLSYQNIFFKYLFIYVNEGIKEELVDAKYYNDKHSNKIDDLLNNLIKWNNNEKIFNYIEISLKTSNKNDRDIEWNDLSHELNHAWDDYHKHLENRSLFTDIDLEDYNTSRELYNNSRNRFEIIPSYINYVNKEFERSSFSVQAMEKLKLHLNKYNNFDEALKWQFKHNEVFARFILIDSWFIQCKESKDLSKSLCNTCRKHYKKYKELTDTEILNDLSNQLNEYYKALTEDINLILNEYGKRNAL